MEFALQSVYYTVGSIQPMIHTSNSTKDREYKRSFLFNGEPPMIEVQSKLLLSSLSSR